MTAVRHTLSAPAFLYYSYYCCAAHTYIWWWNEANIQFVSLPASALLHHNGLFTHFFGSLWLPFSWMEVKCLLYYVWLPCSNSILLFCGVIVQWLALLNAGFCQASIWMMAAALVRLLAHSRLKVVLFFCFVFVLSLFLHLWEFAVWNVLTNISVVLLSEITTWKIFGPIFLLVDGHSSRFLKSCKLVC